MAEAQRKAAEKAGTKIFRVMESDKVLPDADRGLFGRPETRKIKTIVADSDKEAAEKVRELASRQAEKTEDRVFVRRSKDGKIQIVPEATKVVRPEGDEIFINGITGSPKMPSVADIVDQKAAETFLTEGTSAGYLPRNLQSKLYPPDTFRMPAAETDDFVNKVKGKDGGIWVEEKNKQTILPSSSEAWLDNQHRYLKAWFGDYGGNDERGLTSRAFTTLAPSLATLGGSIYAATDSAEDKSAKELAKEKADLRKDAGVNAISKYAPDGKWNHLGTRDAFYEASQGGKNYNEALLESTIKEIYDKVGKERFYSGSPDALLRQVATAYRDSVRAKEQAAKDTKSKTFNKADYGDFDAYLAKVSKEGVGMPMPASLLDEYETDKDESPRLPKSTKYPTRRAIPFIVAALTPEEGKSRDKTNRYSSSTRWLFADPDKEGDEAIYQDNPFEGKYEPKTQEKK
jgi:hypothetical protein